MVNLPPIRNQLPTSGSSTANNKSSRRANASVGTTDKENQFVDRRRLRERRGRRNSSLVMDRRAGLDRRRSRIHFKV